MSYFRNSNTQVMLCLMVAATLNYKVVWLRWCLMSWFTTYDFDDQHHFVLQNKQKMSFKFMKQSKNLRVVNSALFVSDNATMEKMTWNIFWSFFRLKRCVSSFAEVVDLDVYISQECYSKAASPQLNENCQIKIIKFVFFFCKVNHPCFGLSPSRLIESIKNLVL